MGFLKAPFVLVIGVILGAGAPVAHAGKPLVSSRIAHHTKDFYKLYKEKIATCFVETEHSLDFYLSACDEIETKTPQQSFELSERPKTRLPQDILKLRTQILESNAATEAELARLSRLADRDTMGRFILINHNGTKLPVGWISHDLELDENEHRAQVQDLCSGAWSQICFYDHTAKTFKVGFYNGIYDENTGATTELPRKTITDVHFAGVFARGNDDFVPYHYYNVQGIGANSGQTFALSQEWKDALEPKLGAGRIDPQVRQVKTPRGEPNYLTALHPVFVFDVLGDQNQKETKLVFGAAVIYMKNSPAAESCEDDTGSYQLVDFDLFKDQIRRPYSGRDIEKLDLSALDEKSKTIESFYERYVEEDDFESSELPDVLKMKHYDLFNIGTSIGIDAAKKIQTQIIMKIDNRPSAQTLPADVYRRQRSNAVREYIEITQTSSGPWRVNLTAFNPNDYKNSNEVRPDGRFYANPATVTKVWTADEGLTGVTQPFQRALSAELKNWEKKSVEGVESRAWLTPIALQHNKYFYDNFQILTTHAKTGLIGLYANAFDEYTRYGGRSAIENNPMRSILPRVLMVDTYFSSASFAEAKFDLIDPLVIEIFIRDRFKRHAQTMDEALDRIAAAEDPAKQIKTEYERAELIYRQTADVTRFFALMQELKENTDHLNAQLVATRTLPLARRPLKYLQQYRYDQAGNKLPDEWMEFPERLVKLIKGREMVTIEPFFDAIEKDLLKLKALAKAPSDVQIAAARPLYQKLVAENEFLDLHEKLERELQRAR